MSRLPNVWFYYKLRNIYLMMYGSRIQCHLEEVADGKDFVSAAWDVVSPEDQVDCLLSGVILHGPVCRGGLVGVDVFVPEHQFGLLSGIIVDESVLGNGLRFSSLEIFGVMRALQVMAFEHELYRLFLGVVHGDIAGCGDLGVVTLVLLQSHKLHALGDGVVHRSQSRSFGLASGSVGVKTAEGFLQLIKTLAKLALSFGKFIDDFESRPDLSQHHLNGIPRSGHGDG